MKKSNLSYNFLIIGFNLSVLIFYLINFDLPRGSMLYYLIFLLISVAFVTILTLKLEKKIFKILKNFQIQIFSIIILFFFLEFLYLIYPNIFPSNLKIWINKEGKNPDLVEYLDSSPYIKFKPNTIIRSRFYRGTNEQFEYTWKTDSKGFKNKNSISKLSKVKIIAIGNSFTEGMGVKTQDTFPSILTSKGYLTYNLGVQGYSPTQMKGALEKYGVDLKPDYIIAAYTMGTYKREKFFFNKTDNLNYPGGIGTIHDVQINREIRNQAKYVLSGIWLMTKNIRKSLINKFKYLSINLVDKKLSPYKHVALIENTNLFSTEFDKKSWNVTLKAFEEINNISNKINANLIFVYISSRPVIYYERATGKKVPKTALIESELLKKFALKNNITYLDPTQKLIKYVNNLPSDFSLKSLPFLEIDGHLNKIGYEIISNEIISKIR